MQFPLQCESKQCPNTSSLSTQYRFFAVAAPACVAPDAKSVVIASSPSELADGHSAKWRIESVDGARQVILKRCSERNGNDCYFAVDVEPGRYYFKEVIPGPYNHLQYPVSRPNVWFEISGKGVDYIGDWVIDRTNRRASVKLQGRRVYVDSSRLPSVF
jgi:hypothetical protein